MILIYLSLRSVQQESQFGHPERLVHSMSTPQNVEETPILLQFRRYLRWQCIYNPTHRSLVFGGVSTMVRKYLRTVNTTFVCVLLSILVLARLHNGHALSGRNQARLNSDAKDLVLSMVKTVENVGAPHGQIGRRCPIPCQLSCISANTDGQ